MKILIATGGTAGHIFPAIHTADEFRRSGVEVIFVGVFKSHREHLDEGGYASIELPATGLTFKDLAAFGRSVCAMRKAFGQSWAIIKSERPAAVIGFGAYAAFGVVMAAVLQGCPTLIHEQNVRPGRANKFLSFFVRKIAVSFSESCSYFPKARTVIAGYPCRPVQENYRREEIAEKFGLQMDLFTIFVSGGSQGSHRINMTFLDTIGLLAGTLNVQVVHACGTEDYETLQVRYRERGIPFYLTPFLHEIDQAYAFADLAICRAGAGTVTELAGFGVPAILIPYPHAGGHQKENALVLARCNVATVLDETHLNPTRLRDEILSFHKKHLSHDDVKVRVNGVFRKDATQRLVQETLGLIK